MPFCQKNNSSQWLAFLCPLLTSARSCAGMELWCYGLPQPSPWAFSTRSPGMGRYLLRCTVGMLAWVWWCVIGMATCNKHLSSHAIKTGKSHNSSPGSTQEMLSALCHSCCPCSSYFPGRERLVFIEEHLIFLTSVAEVSRELKSNVYSPEWIDDDLGATCGERYVRSCGSYNTVQLPEQNKPTLCNWPTLRIFF